MQHNIRRFAFSVGLGLFLSVASLNSALADGGKIVVTEPFGPRAGWALETDDAFVLTKSGCLEALARLNFDGQLEPLLATGWQQTSPIEWDITLRKGVRFQNGEPFNAEAVAKALNHILTVDAPPRAFSPKVVASVAALDEMTVRITTPEPSVLLPYRLGAPNTGILAPAAYVDGRIDPVGTCSGPFTIVEHIPEQALRLQRNEDYWGPKAQLAEAEFRFIPDGGVRATQVQTGEAQISVNIPVSALEKLRNAQGLQVLSLATPRTTGLYFNNKKPPFDNSAMRRAVQSAIDVTAIADAIYEGSARPAVGPFAPDEPWAPKDAAVVNYDPAQAKSLLGEAGVDAGQLKLGLLAYTERAELPDLAAVIQAQLQQIGISVDIRIANYSALEPDLLAGNFDMFLLSRNHLSDVADPIGFLTADYSCKGGYNLSQFCDPEIDKALDEAGGLEDAAARHQIYANIAQQLQTDAVTTFLVHVEESAATSTKVQNYRIHPYSHYILVTELTLTD